MKATSIEHGRTMSGVLSRWANGYGDAKLSISHNGHTIIGERHGSGPLREKRIATIGAHPDDDTLGKGAQTTMVDGGDPYAPVAAEHLRHGVTRGGGRAYFDYAVPLIEKMRVGEDRYVGRRLRARATTHSDFLDGRLQEYEEAVEESLIPVVRAFAADVYFLPSQVDGHPDHRVVARAGKRAIRRVHEEPGMSDPIVLHFEREDGLVLPGHEPNVVIPITKVEKDLFISAFDNHVTQTGPHLPPEERVIVNKIKGRPAEIAEELHIEGVEYATLLVQDMDFSQADPTDFMVNRHLAAAVRGGVLLQRV